MSKYSNVFPKKNTFLPVVHVESLSQALRNIEVARHHGADGVFLISHHEVVNADHLKGIFQEVKREHPDFWIGLNFLDVSLKFLPNVLPFKADGIWTDDAGIWDKDKDPIGRAVQFQDQIRGYQGLYFGGVAFKYVRTWTDADLAARLAMPLVDVVTTSGKATGSAPDLKKIQSMRDAIGDHPLAVASGIALDNVDQYLDLVDCFLVATSITKADSDCEFDPTKLRELAHRIHSPAK